MVTQLVRPNLDSLQQFLVEKAGGYQDRIINPRSIYGGQTSNNITRYKECTKLPYEDLQFSHSALSQFLYRLRIPVTFYRRNPSWLQCKMFNYWRNQYVTQKKESDKSLLFRFDHANGHNHVRAVLSDMYGIVDDKDLFRVLSEVLSNRHDISYRLFEYDDRITQLYVDFNDCTGEHNGALYTAGLCVTNSETGHSAVWVEPVVHSNQNSFFNRKALRNQGVDCRIIHRGKLSEARLRTMVEKAKEIAQVGIIQLAEQFESHITGSSALHMAKSMEALPSRFIQLLEEEWSEQEDLIKAEAVGRILQLAQELPLFQRIQIQQDTGKTLGLFTNYKDRFSDLAREINNESDRVRDAS